jgi:hypothetical protein
MILSLREKAQIALGNKFDLKRFHDGMKYLRKYFYVLLFYFSGFVEWSITIEYIRKCN